MIMREINLNDLSKYNKWFHLLEKNNDLQPKFKTEKEIVREYESQKWFELHKWAENLSDFSLDSVLNKYDGNTKNGIYYRGKYYLAEAHETNQLYFSYIENILRPYQNCPLAELGAGFGKVLLSIAKRKLINFSCYQGYEYTSNGFKLMNKIAQTENINFSGGLCDFRKNKAGIEQIENKSIIITSYSLCYIPFLDKTIINNLLELNPIIVAHFEPCYEHLKSGKHQLLSRKYTEINDYSRNLSSVLHASQQRGSIKILLEDCLVLGYNPFLPMSAIVWEPTY